MQSAWPKGAALPVSYFGRAECISIFAVHLHCPLRQPRQSHLAEVCPKNIDPSFSKAIGIKSFEGLKQITEISGAN